MLNMFSNFTMNRFTPEQRLKIVQNTIRLLWETFDDQIISYNGPVPSRSCDLKSMDYFLWGYVKSLIYANKPQTLDHLEINIRHVIADIRVQLLDKVVENWTCRLPFIRAIHGYHMLEIIFNKF